MSQLQEDAETDPLLDAIQRFVSLIKQRRNLQGVI